MQISPNTTLRRVFEGAPLGVDHQVIGSVWILASLELAAAIEAANYLDAAAAQLRKGDRILAAVDLDEAPVGKHYIVTAVTPAVVIALAA